MNDQEIIDKCPVNSKSVGCFDDEPVIWTPDNYRSIADIKRIVELEDKNAKMLECLCDISNACIGQITMSYRLDAEDIGPSIYAATGMTNPQMNAALKEPKP